MSQVGGRCQEQPLVPVLELPHAPGDYALHLRLDRSEHLQCGQLGIFPFLTGHYFYLGSAYGPGGLKARLNRHLRSQGARKHWHIDYLLAVARVETILVASASRPPAPSRLECAWSKALATFPEASIPVPGFGASDCHSGCRAHLVLFPEQFQPDSVLQFLKTTAAAGSDGQL